MPQAKHSIGGYVPTDACSADMCYYNMSFKERKKTEPARLAPGGPMKDHLELLAGSVGLTAT